MEEEKYVKMVDGWGNTRRIPESKIPEAEKISEELQRMSRKVGNPEDLTRKYAYRIVRDE